MDHLYGDPSKVVQRVASALGEEGASWVGSQPVPAHCAGALYYRELPNGEAICLYPLLMGTVRLAIGEAGDLGYRDAWCYSVPIAGLTAAACWDGEGDPPTGWFRHVGSGRRRPEGDPEREYVAL